MQKSDRWSSHIRLYLEKKTVFCEIHGVPGQLLCVLERGRGKWVLESRRATELLSAEGNFILMPDWAQPSPLWTSRKRLLGRLCPFINFDQIFTVHHVACLISHFRFSRPGFERFGAICVPFGWTRAMPHSAGPCWCLWVPAT